MVEPNIGSKGVGRHPQIAIPHEDNANASPACSPIIVLVIADHD